MSDKDQVGIDLARHADERVSRELCSVMSLCETPEQAQAVAFYVLTSVAGHAAGAVAAVQGIEPSDVRASELIAALAGVLRGVEDQKVKDQETER